MAEILRTPDERFAGLPGWPFAPRYVDDLPGYEGLRMHYVDEGPADAAQTFLCLHGQPTWGYLYRKMIPVFAAAGHRVVAPDLFGFGRSDKPADDEAYTFDFHRGSLTALIERLDPASLTLVCHDWGGLLGLTLPMEMPERIRRLLVMDTALGTGTVPLPPAFLEWRAYCRANPDLDIAGLMGRACTILSPDECRAYAAPYPDAAYKGGVRRFPEMVPENPEAPGAALSRRALAWLSQSWHGETFMAVGMQDPILGPPAMAALRRAIRGCPEPLEVADAAHFVPEHGAEIASAALAHFA